MQSKPHIHKLFVAMAKKTRPQPDAYQIKIVLRGSKPPIWRRFVVPADIRLDSLHDVIQIVMGWYDCHLHAFVIENKQYTATSKDGAQLDIEGFDEREYRLGALLPSAKAKFRYEYDFGDSWEHVLQIEKIIPAAEGAKTLVCLAGRGRCPMEDCGGIWGYYRMVEILEDPAHPEYADIEEWTGGKIDPDEFDLDAVNAALRQLPH